MIFFPLNTVWSETLPMLLFFLILCATSADETTSAQALKNNFDAPADNSLLSSPGWIISKEDDYHNTILSPESVLVAGNEENGGINNCEAPKKSRRGMQLSKRQRSDWCKPQEFQDSTPTAACEAGAQPRTDNGKPGSEKTGPAGNPSGNMNPTPSLNPSPKRILPNPIQNPKPIIKQWPNDLRRILPGFVDGGNPCNKGFSQVEYSRYKHPVCYPLQQGTVRIAPFGVRRAEWQYNRYGMDLKGGFIRDLVWPCRSSEFTPSSFPASLGEEGVLFPFWDLNNPVVGSRSSSINVAFRGKDAY